MSNCNSNCSSCSVDCNENGCPICGTVGLEVPFETVDNLATPFIKEQLKNHKNENFSLCIHKACKIAYYSDNTRISLDQIKVPIWFKHHKEEYIVCYCRNISLNDIIEAVKDIDGEITKKSVLNYLGKEDIKSDCLHNNPTGICCDRLFDNAIKYAINHKDDKN